MTPPASPTTVQSAPPIYVPPPSTSPVAPVNQTAPAMVNEPDVKMGSGGDVGAVGGIREFFADVNLLDVILSAVVTGTLFYMIYYYKFQVHMAKTNYADINGRLSKIESAVEAAKKKAEANATGSRQRKKGLVGLR